MTGAIIQATVSITGTPVDLVKKDGTPCAYVTAREADDPRKWQLFGLTATVRAAIGRLGPGDTATIRRPIAVRVEAGVVVIAVNVAECSMRLPIPSKPKPKAPKPGHCGRGTKLATVDGVAAANAALLPETTRRAHHELRFRG
jgi:hypothetical protein